MEDEDGEMKCKRITFALIGAFIVALVYFLGVTDGKNRNNPENTPVEKVEIYSEFPDTKTLHRSNNNPIIAPLTSTSFVMFVPYTGSTYIGVLSGETNNTKLKWIKCLADN
jgi:hypothetical protein